MGEEEEEEEGVVEVEMWTSAELPKVYRACLYRFIVGVVKFGSL